MTALCTLPWSHMISPCGSTKHFVGMTGEPKSTKSSDETLATKYLIFKKDPIPDESMKLQE